MKVLKHLVIAATVVLSAVLAYGVFTRPAAKPLDYDGFSSKRVLEDLEVEDSDGEKTTIDKASVYTRKHPGIYICTDDPVGMGGRFNFMKMAVQTDDS